MHKQAKIKSLSYHANEKHNTGNYEESLNLYEQLLELDPINAQANRRAGDALFALEQYQKALTFYGKVLQIDPQNAYAYKHKGDTFFALKHYKEAYTAYQQAKQFDATYSKILYKQSTQLVIEGNTFLEQGNVNAALYLYEFAILFNPQSADAYSQQGKALSVLDRYQEALNAYAQVIRLDPKNTKNHAVKS